MEVDHSPIDCRFEHQALHQHAANGSDSLPFEETVTRAAPMIRLAATTMVDFAAQATMPVLQAAKLSRHTAGGEKHALAMMSPKDTAAERQLLLVLLPTHTVLSCVHGNTTPALTVLFEALHGLPGVVAVPVQRAGHQPKVRVFAHMGSCGVLASIRLYAGVPDDAHCVAEFRKDGGNRSAFLTLYGRVQEVLLEAAACTAGDCGMTVTGRGFEPLSVPEALLKREDLDESALVQRAAAVKSLCDMLHASIAADYVSQQRELSGALAGIAGAGAGFGTTGAVRRASLRLAQAVDRAGVLPALIAVTRNAAVDAMVRLNCSGAVRCVLATLLAQPCAWHTAQRLPAPAPPRPHTPSDVATVCSGVTAPLLLAGIGQLVYRQLQEQEALLGLVPAPLSASSLPPV